MSIIEQLQTPVRRAFAGAEAALTGDPALVTADGERGVAAHIWQACDDELDLALAEVRALEATAAGVRLALVRAARRRGLQHRAGAPYIACWLTDRYRLDRSVARAEAALATLDVGAGCGRTSTRTWLVAMTQRRGAGLRVARVARGSIIRSVPSPPTQR